MILDSWSPPTSLQLSLIFPTARRQALWRQGLRSTRWLRSADAYMPFLPSLRRLASAEWQCDAASGETQSLRVVSRPEQVTSVRQAAAVCNVSPAVVRRWLSRVDAGAAMDASATVGGSRPHNSRGRRRGNRGAHGTITRWNAGCSCTRCCQYQSDTARARGRARLQQRLSAQMRQQCLDAILEGPGGARPGQPRRRARSSSSNEFSPGGDSTEMIGNGCTDANR
jgi:hypothetical protein